MLLKYNNWLAFLGSVLVYFFLHEGLHFIISLCYDEFHKLIFHLYGPEIVYITIVENRKGLQWFLISGMSNMFTIALGYVLYLIKKRFLAINIVFLKSFLYYLTILMLLIDPINLSIGPFIYGGDAKGIATGLGINIYYIQLVSMVVFLVNRELAAQFILQSGVQVRSYILKPININEFIEAVNRVSLKRSDKSPRSQENFRILMENLRTALPSRLAIPTADGMEYLNPKDIIRIEADQSYSWIFITNNRKVLVSKHLKGFQDLLNDRHFFRAHNSHLVNLKFVRKYIRREGGYIEMHDGSQIPISRNRKDLFLVHMSRFKG